MHNFCWFCGGIQLGGKYISYKLCWSCVGMTPLWVFPGSYIQLGVNLMSARHKKPPDFWVHMERLVSRGRQNPTLHKLKLNPRGILEHVVGSCYSKKWSCYLDGWLALACESRHLLSCQATFRRFPPFRHHDHSYGMLECCTLRGCAWLGKLYMLNVDRSGLLTICIYSHARWIRNLLALTCYTLCLPKRSHNY